MYGRFEHAANVNTNSLDIIYRGPNTIEFSDKTKINITTFTNTLAWLINIQTDI